MLNSGIEQLFDYCSKILKRMFSLYKSYFVSTGDIRDYNVIYLIGYVFNMYNKNVAPVGCMVLREEILSLYIICRDPFFFFHIRYNGRMMEDDIFRHHSCVATSRGSTDAVQGPGTSNFIDDGYEFLTKFKTSMMYFYSITCFSVSNGIEQLFNHSCNQVPYSIVFSIPELLGFDLAVFNASIISAESFGSIVFNGIVNVPSRQ